MKLLGLIFTATTFLFFSCTKNEVSPVIVPQQQAPSPLAASTQLNVAYGSDALQKMDIYLPQGRTTATTKVMIMIHGGGWSQGDKADMTPFVDTIQKRFPSYAVINLNYRLVTAVSNFFPTQENDVKAAIEFIFNKRNDYTFSDKFVLLGASAGAHLSLLHAYKYHAPVKIKAVIDFFGPTDMMALYNSPASVYAPPSSIAQLFNGATPLTDPAAYTQSSPRNFTNPQSPPTIILHGGLDPLVKYIHSAELKDFLVFHGVPNRLVIYPNEYHGWVGATLTDSFEKIQAFINQHVQ